MSRLKLLKNWNDCDVKNMMAIIISLAYINTLFNLSNVIKVNLYKLNIKVILFTKTKYSYMCRYYTDNNDYQNGQLVLCYSIINMNQKPTKKNVYFFIYYFENWNRELIGLLKCIALRYACV